MSIEALYLRATQAGQSLRERFTPYLRRVIRLVALPYCYFKLVNWDQCTASRWQVAMDFLYIFFVLKYFPDNYGPCRLWERQREDWVAYFGSSYDPWQRARLRRAVQRQEFEILFEDKQVSEMMCRAADLPIPQQLGIVDPTGDWRGEIAAILASHQRPVILKPVTGSAGTGVVLISVSKGTPEILDGADVIPLGQYHLARRSVVQSLVEQCEAVSAFNSSSVNTVRVLTFLSADGDVLILGASMRFGVGTSCRDNWSAGGVATGVEVSTGTLLPFAYDKRGNRFTQHPTSGVTFRGFEIPRWEEVVTLARRAQAAFPFYRLLGFDVAITDEGPIVIEINAFPDIIFQEQTSGPLLADFRVLHEFGRWDLLINSKQREFLVKKRSASSNAGSAS